MIFCVDHYQGNSDSSIAFACGNEFFANITCWRGCILYNLNLFRLYHYISNVVDAEFNIFYFYYPMVWRSILYWFYESSHLDWPAARGDFAVSDCDCKMLRSGELGWRVRFIQSAMDEWKFLLKVKQVWTLPLRDIWGSGLYLAWILRPGGTFHPQNGGNRGIVTIGGFFLSYSGKPQIDTK